jgi:hypothetical protein
MVVTFPNSGLAVGAITVNQVQTRLIKTSLNQISGTSVDPEHDVGIAFGSNSGRVSFFALSTATEVGTYDTLTTSTVNTLSFFSAADVKVAGAIMNPANQTVVLSTADGLEIVDYADPAAPVLVRSIPSLAVDPINGVEIMANFGFDPAVPIAGTDRALIITGGNQSGSNPVMTLVDADTGTVYRPDAATSSLIIVDPGPPAPNDAYFIDAAAVDTEYHVAVLADRGAGTTFVDLNQLTLDETAGTYTLPSAAVHRITTYFGRSYLAIESTNHLVMMGGRCDAVGVVVGQLSDPASALGFSREAFLRELPAAFDNLGTMVNGWFGACEEPHAIGAYLTPPEHPVYSTPTSLGLWLNDALDHVAVIDIQGVLDGLLSGASYVPTLTTPPDIAYFDIPKVLSVSKAGTGGGTVASAPSGIDCGTSCVAVFDTGTEVTLTATPDATSTFEGWSGGCTGTGPCVVTMSAARSVTATFKRIEHALTVAFPFSGTGNGTVSSSSQPEAIGCPVTCLASVYAGTSVTLTATPDVTSTFVGWGGACTGTGPCTLTMDGPKAITVRFGTPPVAADQSVTTPEDTPLAIVLTATDADSDPLTYRIATQPTQGTLSGTAPNVTYTPAGNYSGADGFTFVANDGLADSIAATVTITVTAVNDPPVANSQSVTTPEDAPLAITLTATDVENSPLTYSIVSGPTNGTLGGTPPNITYTPTGNFNGSDSVTFTANDGVVNSNVATVSITVTAVNDPPVANGQVVTTAEDTPTTIVLTATDTETASLTYSIVAQPTHGTLSAVTGNNVSYTPAADYNGADSFTFVANDGTAGSNVATVSIIVTPVNDAPVTAGQSVNTLEDTPLAITLTATDVENSPLTYSIVAQPTHGTLSGTPPTVTYTPAANYNGPDSLTFRVNDGTVDSNVATVSLTVSSVNDAPVASGQGVTTAEDTATPIVLTATDVDPDLLTYTIVTGPSNGTLSAVTGNNVTYTPAANSNDPDSFTFRANDGTVDSNAATVSVTVTPVSDPPTAADDVATVAEDSGANALDVLANDSTAPDVGETLTITAVTPGTNGGTVTFTASSVTYAPAANFFGTDTFTYTISDGNGGSATATVTVTVAPGNDPPTAADDVATVAEDSGANALDVLANDTALPDAGETLTITLVTQGANGAVAITGGGTGLTYTPTAGFNGTDTFTYTISDGTLTDTATVTITVTGVNDPPTATDDGVTVGEDSGATAIPVLANDSTAPDVGETLTITAVTPGANGAVAITGLGTGLTYTPSANFSGTDTFTYTISDGNGGTDSATVSVTVTAVNDPPVATPQGVTLPEDSSTLIVLTATDAENDLLTFSIVTGPSNGALSTVTENTVTYTPNANFSGSDSFTFRANDGTSDSNIATVTITVTSVNDPVIAADDAATVGEDSGATAIDVLVNDSTAPDPGETLTITAVTPGANGAVAITGLGTGLTYTPSANFSGTDTFTYTISDGNGGTDSATVSVTVTPVNDPPLASAGPDQSVAVTTTVQLDGNGSSDVEGTTLTFQWSFVSVPIGSAAALSDSTSATPTFVADLAGAYVIQLIVNDGTEASAPDTVTVTAN